MNNKQEKISIIIEKTIEAMKEADKAKWEKLRETYDPVTYQELFGDIDKEDLFHKLESECHKIMWKELVEMTDEELDLGVMIMTIPKSSKILDVIEKSPILASIELTKNMLADLGISVDEQLIESYQQQAWDQVDKQTQNLSPQKTSKLQSSKSNSNFDRLVNKKPIVMYDADELTEQEIEMLIKNTPTDIKN